MAGHIMIGSIVRWAAGPRGIGYVTDSNWDKSRICDETGAGNWTKNEWLTIVSDEEARAWVAGAGRAAYNRWCES